MMDTHFEPRRILVVRFSSAGDIVLLSPLLRSLRSRWPSARIAFAAFDEFRELIAENPHVDECLLFDKSRGRAGFREWVNDLKARSFDLIVDAHGNGRSRRLRRELNADWETVIQKFGFGRFLRVLFKWDLLKGRAPMAEHYYQSLAPLDIRWKNHPTEVFVSKERQEKITGLFASLGHPNRKFLGIAPGSSFPKKACPMDRFRTIAHRLLTQTSHGVVLLGGPHDAKLALQGHNDRVLDLQGKTGFQEAAFAAGLCGLVLSNDSALLHLAEAAGTDVFAFFGPTVREFGFFPHRPGSMAWEAKAWCRPCTRHGRGSCFRFERVCFSRIDFASVWEHVKARMDNA